MATNHDDTRDCSIETARLVLESAGFIVSHSSVLMHPSESERDEVFTLYCTIAAALVVIAGLMSGLTLGLMSLDTLDLEV